MIKSILSFFNGILTFFNNNTLKNAGRDSEKLKQRKIQDETVRKANDARNDDDAIKRVHDKYNRD